MTALPQHRPPLSRAQLYARTCRAMDALIEATARDGGLTPREAAILVHRAAAIKLGPALGPTVASHHVRRVAGEIDGRG
jgi:hypothetical protein